MVDNLYKINPIKINIFRDNRGCFYEIYNKKRYSNIKKSFIQNNISISKKNVIRGMHYQKKRKQSQLVTVVKGEINYVVVDVMHNSKNFQKYKIFNLSNKEKNQIYVPGGFANGFEVISNEVILHYSVDRLYDKSDDYGINYKDDSININWSIKKPILNLKDKIYPMLKDIKKFNLPEI